MINTTWLFSSSEKVEVDIPMRYLIAYNRHSRLEFPRWPINLQRIRSLSGKKRRNTHSSYSNKHKGLFLYVYCILYNFILFYFLHFISLNDLGNTTSPEQLNSKFFSIHPLTKYISLTSHFLNLLKHEERRQYFVESLIIYQLKLRVDFL